MQKKETEKTGRYPENITGLSRLNDIPKVTVIGLNARHNQAFADGIEAVDIRQGLITAKSLEGMDAVVSAANSYGFMGGGATGHNSDAALAQIFPSVEETVQAAIGEQYKDGIPLGRAIVVPTKTANPRLPKWLIVAPTMRKPGRYIISYAEAMSQAEVEMGKTVSAPELEKKAAAIQHAGGAVQPKFMADVAADAALAAMITAIDNGLEHIAIPPMGVGTAAGIDWTDYAKALRGAVDSAIEYVDSLHEGSG